MSHVHESTQFNLSDFFAEATLDETSGVIKNIALCGLESKNGYGFKLGAWGSESQTKSLYEGKPVFIDHVPPEKRNRPHERSLRDMAATVVNVRQEGGKPRSDLKLINNESGRLLKSLYESRPPNVGMSHVAAYTYSQDHKTVESVNDVVSVDVVAFPATTNTFQENTQGNHMADPTIELLTKQLADLRTESDAKFSKLQDSYTKLEAVNVSLTASAAKFESDLKAANAKVSNYEAQAALVLRRESIEAALKASGLNAADKVVVSESFIKTLMDTAEESDRKAMIDDRKAVCESAANGKVIVTQGRQTTQAGAPANFESISKTLSVPLFS